jgi:hypothetical protein
MYFGEPLTPRFFAGSLLILGCGAALMLVPLRANLLNRS